MQGDHCSLFVYSVFFRLRNVSLLHGGPAVAAWAKDSQPSSPGGHNRQERKPRPGNKGVSEVQNRYASSGNSLSTTVEQSQNTLTVGPCYSWWR